MKNHIECPCGCDSGQSFNKSTGTVKQCTVCEGTGKLSLSRAAELDLEYLFKLEEEIPEYQKDARELAETLVNGLQEGYAKDKPVVVNQITTMITNYGKYIATRNLVRPKPAPLTKAEQVQPVLEDLARPLVKWINENGNPYTSIVISYDSIKVFSQEIGIPILDYMEY